MVVVVFVGFIDAVAAAAAADTNAAMPLLLSIHFKSHSSIVDTVLLLIVLHEVHWMCIHLCMLAYLLAGWLARNIIHTYKYIYIYTDRESKCLCVEIKNAEPLNQRVVFPSLQSTRILSFIRSSIFSPLVFDTSCFRNDFTYDTHTILLV